MSRVRVIIFTFLLCVLLPTVAAAQSGPPNHTLTVLIDEKGGISLEVKLVTPPPVAQTPQADANHYGLFIVALPLALNLKDKNLNAPNLRVAPLHVGTNYTLLALIVPVGLGEVNFRLDDVGRVTETPEGKALLELDTAYRDMPQSERDLFRLPITVSTFDLTIVLPREYDVKDVGTGPPSLTKAGDRAYSLSHAQGQAGKVWISFPNPIKKATENATLIVSFLLSCLGVLMEFKAFKERDIKWPLGVFILALAILGVGFYFGYVLRRDTAFLTLLAVSVPQVLYGLGASVYRLLAAKWQTEVTGYVTIEGKPSNTAQVYLERRDKNDMVVDRATCKEGYYKFYVWLKKPPRTYRVHIPANAYREEGASQTFSLTTTEPYEAEALDLKSLVVAGQAADDKGQRNQPLLPKPLPST